MYDHSLQLHHRQFLVLLIYHPYLHEMIFILVCEGKPRAPKMVIRAYITYACRLAQTAPLLSRPELVTRPWRLFKESVGRL